MAKGKKKNKDEKSKTAPVSRREMTRLGGALRALGGVAGSAVGGLIGQPVAGSGIGTQLGAAISKWLGSGDYMLSKNSLMTGNNIPMMHRTGQSVIVRHKEFVCDVYGNTGFGVARTFPLNPGLEGSFPWLAGIAQQFQEYSWKGLVYHYVPTSGESVASTNTALGTVILSTNYRANQATYLNKVQMLNEYFSSDSRPCECFVHPIECNPKENPFNVQYIRTGAIASGDNPMLYDLGVTSLAVSGTPSSGGALGELWCTYEVELRKPISQSMGDVLTGYAHFLLSTLNSANTFGTARSTSMDTIGLIISPTTITWPTGSFGSYLVLFWANNAAAMSTASTFSLSNLVQNSGIYSGGTYSMFTSFASTSSGVGGPFFATIVTKQDVSTIASMTLAFSTLTSSNIGDLLVIQVPTNYA